jgi:hypothetical protein
VTAIASATATALAVALPPTEARAWRILYHSRALDGRDVAESGIVVAPAPRPPAAAR